MDDIISEIDHGLRKYGMEPNKLKNLTGDFNNAVKAVDISKAIRDAEQKIRELKKLENYAADGIIIKKRSKNESWTF